MIAISAWMFERTRTKVPEGSIRHELNFKDIAFFAFSTLRICLFQCVSWIYKRSNVLMMGSIWKYLYGGFQKLWVPQTIGFPLIITVITNKEDDFVVLKIISGNLHNPPYISISIWPIHAYTKSYDPSWSTGSLASGSSPFFQGGRICCELHRRGDWLAA